MKKYTATQLKWIALIAMIIDHLAWAFFDYRQPPAQVLHFIGRLTFPLMAFLIAQGTLKTRNKRAYFFRLGSFALISHLPFRYMTYGPAAFSWGPNLLENLHTSILYPFSLAVLAIWLYRDWQGPDILKGLLIFLLCILALPGDYAFFAVLLPLAFSLNQDEPMDQIRNGALVIGFLVILAMSTEFPGQIYMLGTFLPLLLIHRYNGRLGRSKSSPLKYLFYLFYPLHMVIIGLLHYGWPNL